MKFENWSQTPEYNAKNTRSPYAKMFISVKIEKLVSLHFIVHIQ